MEMATLQFYKNPYRYPRYTEQLTSYGTPMECTPVGMNLRSGTLRVKGDFNDFMSCNYLALTRSGRTIFAWIDNVAFRTEDSFDVSYSVDAWRTYKGKINLGTQFVKRSPVATNLKDNLLGSTQPFPAVESTLYSMAYSYRRILVVQVRSQTGEPISNAPVQPTPYNFFLCPFTVTNWQDSAPIVQLMDYLKGNAQTTNIVTMYSIPYCDLTGLDQSVGLPVSDGQGTTTISGFYFISATADMTDRLHHDTPLVFNNVNDMLRVDHSVQIVIPEAGIINVPDELLAQSDLRLRQDIDLFSGASNYMLVTGNTAYFDLSVRGSSIASIPIVSDPYDTYISQNQNALATSLIGDVASLAVGAGMLTAGGGVAATLGAGAGLSSGLNGLMNTASNLGDVANRPPSNPPAFLGTALVTNFNQCFWTVVRRASVTNADAVHTNYGYPCNLVQPLTFPSSGYIETEACNVWSDGSVPRWAIEEINSNFNNGILVI